MARPPSGFFPLYPPTRVPMSLAAPLILTVQVAA
jgi:hypothetical protein